MAMNGLSFVAGVLILLYLATLALFALLRLFTGISIQRPSFNGLRRIAYSPKDGIKLEIRGLGIQVHRPTFAQPTWLSLVITELRLSIDITKLKTKSSSHPPPNGDIRHNGQAFDESTQQADVKSAENVSASKKSIWNQLMKAKNQIKQLQSKISWIRLVDIAAHRTCIDFVGIGALEIGTVGLQVDTRKTTVDRTRLFHHTPQNKEQVPAEWTLSLRTVSFIPAGKEPDELLDYGVVNIHGFLNPKIAGLRDASLSVKIGRLHLPYDTLHEALEQIKAHRQPTGPKASTETQTTTNDGAESQDELLSTLRDAKDFLTSAVHGIRDISVLVAYVGTSMRVDYVRPGGNALYLNMSMREIGLDIYRLHSATPAHSMYFHLDDIAHQALLSALAFSLGIDDGHDHPERLVYVPMTTVTFRTTLPGKLIEYAEKGGDLDLNTNVLLANLVITSPAVDLDPGHLPIILAIPLSRPRHKEHAKPRQRNVLGAAYQLLPKLSAKLLIHEPVVRIAIPPVNDAEQPGSYDFDLIVSAISSISIDIDASHSSSQKERYAILSSMRVIHHRLYYQTRIRETQDLLVLESMQLQSQITAAPALSVVLSGNLQTLSCLMVRPEVSEALRRIIKQLRTHVKPAKLGHTKTSRDPNFVRALPGWLDRVEVEAHDLTFEVAGVDSELSPRSRGVALHVDSWTADYKAHPTSKSSRRPTMSNRRNISQTALLDEEMQKVSSHHEVPAKEMVDPSDGRRLELRLHGFTASTIEDLYVVEPKPFLSLPKSEIALTTRSDKSGPMFHVNCYTKGIYVNYSLFRHYAIGIAVIVLRQTMAKRPQSRGKSSSEEVPQSSKQDQQQQQTPKGLPNKLEFISVEVKIPFVQVKADLPSEPAMMLHLENVEVGRYRSAHPHVRANSARLYAQSPTVAKAWSRIISIRNPRVDIRQMNHVHNDVTSTEKSIDLVSDAIRIGVPNQLIVHDIFDNVANMVKTVKQLHHRFKTESDDYILAKHPEGPKHLPRISVRTHVFLFEIEDGPFEYKLSCIYRAGLLEQKQRLAREAAFNLKTSRCASGVKGLHPDTAYHSNPARPLNRARSLSPSGRNSSPNDHRRSSSEQRSNASPTRHEKRDYGLRYDKRGTCNLTGVAYTSDDEAWEKLQVYNAQSWRKRIDSTLNEQSAAIQDIRKILWGVDSTNTEDAHNETILEIPKRPALMQVLMSDLNIVIDKPSFPLSQLPDFLHDVGKGLPRDTEFSLLVPMHWTFEMGETRMTLRDYPLPLIHVPAIQAGQQPRHPSWSLKTNFIVAEEFRGVESTRDINVMIIPADKMGPGKHAGGFAIDVRRTCSPVKTYSDMKIEVNTARDTRFAWGTSYQAAIQHMMQTIEGFTKPQLDPSDRVGFWDKLRLVFHSRINMNWRGNGDVHVVFKGTRDPYRVTGHGAGLIMIWRNGVQWNINQDPDPRAFMTVDAGDYVLAVPDFAHYARVAPEMVSAHTQERAIESRQHEQKLKKVVMKLSGKVRWQLGMVFERDLEEGKRSFDFIPHYDVVTRNPVHIKESMKKNYDAFRGFRSNHIHMNIAVSAPADRNWSVTNLAPSDNYNSVHLSPKFFTHFFAWWSMFSGVMSLPVHQGRLWPVNSVTGKKFGRHLATIKYSLLLAPLYISHVYKHKDADEWADDIISATGVKARLDSFILDMHQRREEFTSQVKGLNKTVKTSHMKINQALLDLAEADVRAVSASLEGRSLENVRTGSDEQARDLHDAPQHVNLSRITIPDNDYSWVDADDFVEIDWTLPVTSAPETRILPLAYFPRFTYRRQTDHSDNISGDKDRHSAFGYEHTHHCVMSSGNDPRAVQIHLIKERLHKIDKLLEDHKHAMEEQQLEVVKETDARHPERNTLEELRKNGEILHGKKHFLHRMLSELQQRMENPQSQSTSAPTPSAESFDLDGTASPLSSPSENPHHGDSGSHFTSSHYGDDNGVDLSSLPDYVSDFNNRFVVHNAQIKWNNSLRNIMLRYIHQVSQRRGFVYYTSRRAVKFILDIIEDQQKVKRQSDSPVKETHPPETAQAADADVDEEVDVQARIDQLLEDGNKFVNADDNEDKDADRKSSVAGKAAEDVSRNFMAQNSYHLRLIAPQVQLQSEKNTKTVVLVTARGMRLKVLQIMDKDRMQDDVSGLVQTRFAAEMDNMQFFVTTKKSISPMFLKLFAGNVYGAAADSAWPPWAPIEAMFNVNVDTYGFQRVVQRTSASLRYDKYNHLRLKYSDNVHSEETPHLDDNDAESRMDHLWIEFPQLRAICDSQQYYAIYVIILDLLMWNEPLEKNRHERLEKIMLASDFSDLTGAPELVIRLQERIRDMNEIKTHFHVHEEQLDKQAWQDRISLEQDLAACEEELFFIMKAISTSQQKVEERAEGTSNGMMKWFLSASEIVWHLTRGADQPLAEFQLNNATYERTDNSDGSNLNAVEIDRIYGVSLLPDAVYPEIIAAHTEQDHAHHARTKMLQVRWLKLEAIAGINVVDHFEVNLHPLRIQIEYETGRKLFEYVFPHVDNGEDGFSPFMVKGKLNNTEGFEEEIPEEDPQEAMERTNKALAGMPGAATGAGLIEYRLQPTFVLPPTTPHANAPTRAQKPKPLHAPTSDKAPHNHRNIFSHHPKDSTTSADSPQPQASFDNLSITSRGRTSSTFSGTSNNPEKEHGMFRRFGIRRKIHRSNSTDSKVDHKKDPKKDANKKDGKKNKAVAKDDLSQMLNRASNYMTLAYVKIPSVVLCLSYKGKTHRNFEDVHNLVFRMPTLEYRNKTWSNLDLALALKKDVIRALISHTGAIIGNKFTHRKPGRQQIGRLQELAYSSVVMSSNEIQRITSSAAASILPLDDMEEDPRLPHRPLNYDEDNADTLSQTISTPSTNTEAMEAEDDRSERPRLSTHLSNLTARSKEGNHAVESAKAKVSKGLSAVAHIGRRRDTVGSKASVDRSSTMGSVDGTERAEGSAAGEDGEHKKGGLKKKLFG